jgi:cell division septal protein FtsQ
VSVKAPAEKNFRRSKVKPVKKNEGRRISLRVLRIVVPMALAVFAAYRAFDLVLTAAPLQVRRIVVRGHDRLTAGEVEALMDGAKGSNILSLDLSEYRDRVLQSPWVADAALRRVIPSTIEVFISERRPLGLCRLGNQLYLLDRTATLIDEYGPQYANLDLPIIDGVVRAPSGKGRGGSRPKDTESPVIDEERTDLAAQVIDSLAAYKSISDRVSQIDVSDSRNAVILLDDDTAQLRIGNEKFVERLQLYLDMAPALKQHVSEIDYVDLRFGRGIVVHPREGNGAAETVVPAAMPAEAVPQVGPARPTARKNVGGRSKAKLVKSGRRR